MAFCVGQKVVCVDASPKRPDYYPGFRLRGVMDGLQEGAIYTVSGFENHPLDGKLLLVLMEIKRPRRPGPFCLDGYDARRFRPLVERKTSIEIFKRMLTPKKARVRA